MDIRDLNYFEVIATIGNFGRAAEQLGRTKPALSKCVRRLEAEIGAPLFQRSGRGAVLTPPGRALLQRARHVQASMADTLREVSDLVAGRQGHVRIGIGTFVIDSLLPSLYEWLAQEQPDVTMELHTGFNDELRQGLLDDRLDGIVTAAQVGDDMNFTKEDWYTEEVVVVARPEHPLAARPQITAEDLTAYNWVLLGHSIASRQWLDWAFSSRGLAVPRARVEIVSYRFLPTFLRQTDLLGFMPRAELGSGHFGQGLVELPCIETTMRRMVSSLHRRNGYVSPALRRLISFLRRSAVSTSDDRPPLS
jgi:DNA-binding transcriptional LysR family regulator